MHAAVATAILCCLAATFSTAGYAPVAPFLVPRTEDVKILLTAQGVGMFLALVPAGVAVDRLGSIPVLKSGVSILFLACLVSALSVDFFIQLVGRILSGAAASVMFNSAMAMVMDFFVEPERGANLGMVLGIGTLGNVAGPPITTGLFAFCKAHGTPEPQALPMLIPAGIVSVALLTLQRIPQRASVLVSAKTPLVEGGIEDEKNQSAEASVKQGTVACATSFFGLYGVGDCRVWVIAAVLSLLFGTMAALMGASSLDMKAHGYHAAVVGLTAVPAGAAQMVLARVGGRFCESRRSRMIVMVIGSLGLAVGLLLVVLGSRFAPLAAKYVSAMLLASSAMAFVDAASISEMGHLATEWNIGYGQSVMASELAVTLGQSLGPYVGILILEAASFDALCLSAAGAAVFVGLAGIGIMPS